MKQLPHGGDWAGYRAEFGRDPLDFSANVSPLGLPEGVAKAITAALATADRYPDPLCRALREKLAVAEGVPAEWLLCGNGAADLIFRLALAAKPRTALVTAPTFAEYAIALETEGCTVERHFLREENDFAVTKDLLNAVHPGTNMVFLCQPNNRSRGCGAGRGRMLSGFSAGGRRPFGKASAEKQQKTDYFKSLHQALRHGRRAAGLLPVL